MRSITCVLVCLLLNLTQLYAQDMRVKGVVISADDGDPVIGASVFVKGTTIGTVTNVEGEFILNVPANTPKLTISYIGMVAQEVDVKPELRILLKSDTQNLTEVVVQAGIVQRDRLSFTGSYSTVTREELKLAGNQNILQSLRSVDPSFVVLESGISGSNPNALPNIEVRGANSVIIGEISDEGETVSSANQPLFILNGFETTLDRVNDLDINRIESITILKDAASTAIYGARAANGVVVIETIKPKPGEIQISYVNDSNISWADLGSYNMMNSTEKLEYERLAGKYYINDRSVAGQERLILLQQVYYNNLAKVQSGVDTYWLKEPIRTAFTTRNSLLISGGSDELFFNAGVSYKSMKGVMKGDGRNSWEGNLDLTYRKNRVSVTNEVTISGTNITDSPYAPFSNWVNANPYFTMRDENGEVNKYLERMLMYNRQPIIYSDTYNPLYNALLDSESTGNIFTLTNNLQLRWSITDDLRFTAAVALKKKIYETTRYIDPRDTRYEGVDYTEKGSYTNSNNSSWGFEGNANLAYSKVLNNVHRITLNARAEIGEDRYTLKGFSAVGFPEGANGVPSYAHAYKPDSQPDYSETTNRRANLLALFSYTYDSRYVVEGTYRLDGATTFGSNNLFKSFWSTGIGWNIFQEEFARDLEWLDYLKLKASYGLTGNQTIGSFYSSSIYSYYTGSSIFGQGAYLLTYGNPDLQWQKSKKLNVGIEMETLNKRFTLRFDVFKDRADPLPIHLPQPPSTGMKEFPTNLGYLDNKGLEFTVGISPIYNLKERIVWNIRVSGMSTKNKYGGFGDALEELNLVEDYTSSSSLYQYRDGYSTTDLWAIKSLGIDPATGNEVYLTKDGERTFEYDPVDRIKVGSTNPSLYGTIATTFTYKKLTANFILRYSIGSSALNTALFNKVENISRGNISYNQDKRALYDRWQQAGDIAQFRRIDDLTNKTYLSSRFVQKNNYLVGESFSLSWDFSSDKWVQSIGLAGVRFNVYANDIFRCSTIKAERSSSYPYAKSISFGLTASY